MCSKIGIVGTPDQISLLVPVFHSLQFRITALWCKNLETCRKLAEKFRIPFPAANFKEVLLHPDVDLVYVATEPGMHAEVAVKTLTSGKHCICQKPPSFRQSEAQKMVSLSHYYNQLMSLLDNYMRFLPAVSDQDARPHHDRLLWKATHGRGTGDHRIADSARIVQLEV